MIKFQLEIEDKLGMKQPISISNKLVPDPQNVFNKYLISIGATLQLTYYFHPHEEGKKVNY